MSMSTIVGTANDDTLVSDGHDDSINGLDGDDVIFGGIGNDTLSGDNGNDTITGSAGNDQLFGGEGNDSLTAGNDHTYLDGGDGTDTLIGGADGDYIYDIYGGAMNVLSGNGGNDYLAGDGTLSGGDGNDTIGYFDGPPDKSLQYLPTSVSGGAGDDSITSLFSGGHDLLAPNTLDGGDGNDTIVGGDDPDLILGDNGLDSLSGGAGDDRLNGGSGADTMYGGAGNDVYYVDNAGDVVSEQTTPGTDDGGTDLVYATVSYTLPDFVENLWLQGAGNINGIGNTLNNVIHGNNSDNVLSGLDGNDSLLGGGGNDSLDGGTGNDYLDSGTGNDTIVGGAGNDTLIAAGVATMHGGAGDDTYYVNNSADIVSEQTTPGIDDGGHDTVYASVSFTLGNGVEDLWLTAAAGNADGTGNALVNIIHGNNSDNVLLGMDGDDSLLGAGGNDSLDGGTGNDYLDAGTGNDTIVGGGGNDTLIAAGIATMHGGAGDDTYYVNNADDVISEEATPGIDDGGHDIVYSTVSFTLSRFVEDMTLMAAAGNANATGNAGDNIIHGNNSDNVITGLDGNDVLLGGGGNDSLDGGSGNDILVGGAGADRFAFEYAGAANGFDTVADYAHGTDSLWFNGADYGVSVGGTLSANMFTTGASAAGTHAQFVWDAANHTLYWDDDGTGADAAIAIATFTGVTNIDATDFHFK
jgi:serralysin